MIYGTNINLTKNKSNNELNTKVLEKKGYTPFHEFQLTSTEDPGNINQKTKKGILQKVMSKAIKS